MYYSCSVGINGVFESHHYYWVYAVIDYNKKTVSGSLILSYKLPHQVISFSLQRCYIMWYSSHNNKISDFLISHHHEVTYSYFSWWMFACFSSNNSHNIVIDTFNCHLHNKNLQLNSNIAAIVNSLISVILFHKVS